MSSQELYCLTLGLRDEIFAVCSSQTDVESRCGRWANKLTKRARFFIFFNLDYRFAPNFVLLFLLFIFSELRSYRKLSNQQVLLNTSIYI